jgi:endogenous inhibitor of DNA gyrase (YacG/DUF329 family)
MGYRIYLGKMLKTELTKLNKLTMEEFNIKKEKDEWYSVMDEVDKDIYEFGKYVEWTEGDFQKYCSPIIQDKQVNEWIEGDFYSINKEGLAFIIEYYRKEVYDYYKYMSNIMKNVLEGKPNEKLAIANIYNHINGMAMEWASEPYILSTNKDSGIVSSWKYEYAVFELANVYKNFDYENYEMIIYGY